MRNIRKVLLLSMLGMLGCKNGNVENKTTANNANDIIKTDTALVVGYDYNGQNKGKAICYAFQDGRVYTETSSPVVYGGGLGARTECGDMVIAATYANGRIAIIRNLTQETKIKVFAKQR